MISSAHLWAFLITATVIIMVPGPSVLFVVSRAMVLGRRGAMLTVVGNAAGEAVQVLAVAVGVGAVVQRSIVVFSAVKLVGVAYLVYLGVQAIRHRRALASVLGVPPTSRSTWRVLREGFVVGFSNPKSVVFFVAVLPQFVDRSAGRVPLQLLLLGLMFLLIALMSDTLWAVAAGWARGWFERSPGRLAAIGGLGGLAMIGIGARLAVTGRND